MADRIYVERAAQRRKLLLLVAALALLAACAGFGARNLFFDRCTASFERSPEAVARSYVQAVCSICVITLD